MSSVDRRAVMAQHALETSQHFVPRFVPQSSPLWKFACSVSVKGHITLTLKSLIWGALYVQFFSGGSNVPKQKAEIMTFAYLVTLAFPFEKIKRACSSTCDYQAVESMQSCYSVFVRTTPSIIEAIPKQIHWSTTMLTLGPKAYEYKITRTKGCFVTRIVQRAEIRNQATVGLNVTTKKVARHAQDRFLKSLSGEGRMQTFSYGRPMFLKSTNLIMDTCIPQIHDHTALSSDNLSAHASRSLLWLSSYGVHAIILFNVHAQAKTLIKQPHRPWGKGVYSLLYENRPPKAYRYEIRGTKEFFVTG